MDDIRELYDLLRSELKTIVKEAVSEAMREQAQDKPDFNPRKELVDYCKAKNISIQDMAAIYKLNNQSKPEDFTNALDQIKKTFGE